MNDNANTANNIRSAVKDVITSHATPTSLSGAVLEKISKQDYDLVVYDATPGGIACAIRAAREGLNVLLVNHSARVGGILSNGLSVFDTLYNGPRAPIYDEIRHAIYDYYRKTYGEDSSQYKASLPGYPKVKYEPKVIEKIFDDLIVSESKITLLREFYPIAATFVERSLSSITFSNKNGEKRITALGRIFADCSYEGDLAAVANVKYRVGREARSEFNEPHAGRIFLRRVPLPKNMAPLLENRRLNLVRYERLLEVIPEVSTGAADPAVQAYNLRTLLTNNPENRIIPEKPDNYDPSQFRSLRYEEVLGPLPNQKYCWNLPELVGMQTQYVEGDWNTRQKVIAAHREATIGLLYYLQNDNSIAPEVQARWRQFGLPRDEFTESGHLPSEIYVREARRIDGRYIFTEHDSQLAEGLRRAPVHFDSIAITEWYLDSHACTPAKFGDSLLEGQFLLNNITWPGQVPYRTILSKDLDNLLIPVCLSSSHVGWCAIRLEPTWMSIGESAAYAATLALRRNVSPAGIDSGEFLGLLANKKMIITFFNDVEVDPGTKWLPAVQYLGARGFFGSYDARPFEKVTSSLALAWARACLEIMTGFTVEDTTRAANIWSAEQIPDTTLTGLEFKNLLRATLPPTTVGKIDRFAAALAVSNDIPITRADACQLMFALLNKPLGYK